MSNTRPTKLPEIPTPADPNFSESVREVVEVWANRRGDPLDSVVTVRMLRDGGLADVDFTGGLSGGGRRSTLGGPNGSPIFLNPTPPGTNPLPAGHLNVRTRSVWDGIMIQWDWPPGNVEYSATEIYAAQQIDPLAFPTFDDALLVGTSSGNLFVHTNLGLGKVWYYWIRYVGFVPAGGTTPPYSAYTPATTGRGVRGETAADPAYVLAVLSGAIGEAQLQLGLGNRIDLVDYYYNAQGIKVPVPQVELINEGGQATGIFVSNVQNRVLAAVRDVGSDFQVAIAQEASIRGAADDVIIAAYSVKIDIGGYVTGFGLVATRSDNGDLVPPTFDSAFVIRSNRFAVVIPDLPGAPAGPPVIPFVVGPVNGVNTVGINGALVVDGTILARHIQANTIGAAQINATEVWAGVVSADRVFASRFATSGDLNWRVEIGGQNETYPFWYGQGVKGGPNSAFFFDRFGNTTLAGNLTVSGTGLFSTAGGIGTARAEIGGSDGNVFWAGEGPRTNANAKFRINAAGDVFIRGLALTQPSAGGSSNIFIDVVPNTGQPTARVFAMATGVVIERGNEDDGKAYTVELWIGNVKAAEYRCESMDEEFLPVAISGVADVGGGAQEIRVLLSNIDYSGGGGGLTIERTTLSAFQVTPASAE